MSIFFTAPNIMMIRMLLVIRFTHSNGIKNVLPHGNFDTVTSKHWDIIAGWRYFGIVDVACGCSTWMFWHLHPNVPALHRGNLGVG